MYPLQDYRSLAQAQAQVNYYFYQQHLLLQDALYREALYGSLYHRSVRNAIIAKATQQMTEKGTQTPWD